MKYLVGFTAQVAVIAGVAFVGNAEPLRLKITPVTTQYEPLDQDEHHCLTEAIYWEAGNQSNEGKFAVGNVILNRVASNRFPNTICGVVHQGPMDGSSISLNRCQFSYYCDGHSDSAPTGNILEIEAWDFASIVAETLMYGEIDDNTLGSTYYHADYVSPWWAEHYNEVIQVDSHIFYVHDY